MIHDDKLFPSFYSRRRKRGYNPDLIFISSRMSNLVQKNVLPPIPRTQHRLLLLIIRSAIEPTTVPFHRCFNFKKADWVKYKAIVEEEVKAIKPVPENYGDFINMIQRVSRKTIPRGCCKNYIPGLYP